MAIDLTEYNDIVDNLIDKVKEIALTEYTAGRIRDVEYGKYMASAVGSVIANAGSILESYYRAKLLSETVDTDILIKEQQLALLTQQKLTEVQQTAKATYEVGTLFVDEHNLKTSQKAMIDQQKLTETQNTNVVATQYYVADNSKTTDINMKSQQLAILTQQFTNLKTELSLKQQTVAKSLNVQDQQISQMEAEEAYTTQKTIVLEASRLDNKRIQAADKYQQFLSMLSANVVPSSTDIANCRILMKDIIDETDTTITATTPTVTENADSQAYNASISG